MKMCPYCAEEIQDAAVKCKHCGEFLDASQRPAPPGDETKWYFRTSFIVFAVCFVGPLALPLIWWRPKTSLAWKVGLTIGILALTWFLYQMTMESIRSLMDSYRMLEGM
jgi:hypothetical protein